MFRGNVYTTETEQVLQLQCDVRLTTTLTEKISITKNTFYPGRLENSLQRFEAVPKELRRNIPR